MNEKADGLSSLSEVIDKYAAVEDEKDLYIVYIPDSEGHSSYAVTDFAYWKEDMTAILVSVPNTVYQDKGYSGYLAAIYVPKNIGLTYNNFTALLTERPDVFHNGGDIYLGDIEKMNIGAEMPKILYCENGKLILQGTFGLLVYNLEDKRVTDRLSYAILNKIGIDILDCTVSADGERVYIRRHGTSAYLYTYYLNTMRLFDYGGEAETYRVYKGLNEWNYDGEADIPQEGYIYSSERKHGENGGCYLRAKDNWSMKSLQAIVYDHTGKTEIIDIFR